MINYKNDFIYLFFKSIKKIFRLINIIFKRQRENDKKISFIKCMNAGGLFTKGSLTTPIPLILPTPTPAFIPFQSTTPSPDKLSLKIEIIFYLEFHLKPRLLPR